MRKILVYVFFGAVALAVVTFIAWWENPVYRTYRALYHGDGIRLKGKGSGYFHAEYFEIQFGYVIPDTRVSTFPLEIHVDGEAIRAADVTEERLKHLGAKRDESVSDIPNTTTWIISQNDTCGLVFLFSEEKLAGVEYIFGGGERCDRVKIAWNEQPPISLPIREDQMKRYFGVPDHIERSHSWFQ